MSRTLLFLGLIICILCTEKVYAQDSARVDIDSLSINMSDTLITDSLQVSDPDSLEPPKPEFERISPWKTQAGTGFKAIRDDSLLRWEIWPNWGDFYAYRHNAVSFRQGTTGRIDAFEISGYGPYEQEIRVDGIDISDPVTGLVNFNLVPTNKIGLVIERMAGNYESDIELKDYYLTKPLSHLNFDEASYNYRNLEFMVAQNFEERTNLEISFWDRRDGGNFVENDVQGNQILVKGYHFLREDVQIRGTILRNEINREEPFGYDIGDISTFDFNEFTTQSNVVNAQSQTLRRDLIVGIYHRADSTAPEQAGLAVKQTLSKLDFPNSRDTLFWETSSYTLEGFRQISNNSWKARLSANMEYNNAKRARNFSRQGWMDIQVRPEFELDVSQKIELSASGRYGYRTTDHHEFELSLYSGFRFSNRTNLSMTGSLYSKMPTIQTLYWSSGGFTGNENLENRQGFILYGKIENEVSRRISIGASTRFSTINNDFFVNSDSLFTNGSDYSELAGTLFGSYRVRNFEFESSVTTNGFLVTSTPGEETNTPDSKVWIRNNVFIQGYLYDRATYVRGGVKTVFSPIPYVTRAFNSELQFWETSSSEQWEVPSFFRLDAELSARLRGMMILIRWENLLDGVSQAGYFESASLPMPGRRLIVGIRAQFRN
ncbi:MAG: hypothetical protein MI700_05665 [Balneolales bacterium]|nr:hypothetical protein [Balneolales bacterium]